MKYIEKKTLACRGPVDPLPSEEIDGTLLIGEKRVLHFYSGHSSYGKDGTSIFPAFHNGIRCWLRRDEWCPAYGYSASGTNEYILFFEEGVKLFLEQGVFHFTQE